MSDTRGFTVLVVEDDPSHQLLIRKSLGEEGSPFSVVQFADNSTDAEHFARQMTFDVFLVDNRIPGRRGLDLISYLKDGGADAPFVLMTSAGNEDLAVAAYRSQVADYIVKDAGFWRDLPQLLSRVVEDDRRKKSERRLHERLELANARLDELNTEVQLQNQQLLQTQADLSTRNTELESANKRLREAYRTLGDFTFVIARSLDRPMSTIHDSLSHLADLDLQNGHREHLTDLNQAAAHITHLLERLRTMGAVSTLDTLETPDPEAVFDRVQADLARGTS